MSKGNGEHTERITISKTKDLLEVPNLIELQLKSYENFLQQNVSFDKREDDGLEAVFIEVFPVEDYNGKLRLEYIGYEFGTSKYSVQECKDRDGTYSAPLRIKLRLINRNTGEIKEQDVYMGDIPLMTDIGTFIVNGAERVIVNQLHRSPGLSFDDDEGKSHPSGKKLYSGKIIPYRGSWIEFEYDVKDTLYVHMDRKRKLPSTILLRALGYETDYDIMKEFYPLEEVSIQTDTDIKKNINRILGHRLADNVVNTSTGEVLAKSLDIVTSALITRLQKAGVKKIKFVDINEKEDDVTIIRTLEKDDTHDLNEALLAILEVVRPGEPPTYENAKAEFNRLYFNPRRYDLGRIGRYQINKKLQLSDSITDRQLRKEDVLEVIKRIVFLHRTQGESDDTDHLANRRVRSVGELLQNQLRIGLMRLERVIRERMSINDEESITPQSLINIKPITAIVKEFFGSSQLSQFMDQTNPIAALTHKRRLSALGPGGLKRERAMFDVRDVHRTHYSRICPIETPEGPNIGLIISLAGYARVNSYGFVEAPYRKVVKGKLTDEVVYMPADVEDNYTICEFIPEGKRADADMIVRARRKEKILELEFQDTDYCDISPHQTISITTSLIPFLEHDDANRALMGSNMQRQGVPLLFPEAPVVGTGMEKIVARDSGLIVIAEEKGVVKDVSSDQITVTYKGNVSYDRKYQLLKYERSNQSTCINQRPIVKKGQKFDKGEVLADGPAIDRGELALGSNVVVAFMSWEGYNFEDAILLSERMVKDDVYTSVHIEKFELEARDTKLGKEIITRDIPSINEETVGNLDEDGIIRIGASVEAGDYLVGKVTPKSDTDVSPEHKLLHSIFGEKARDVRDTSLKLPHGQRGIVIDVKSFSRANGDELNPGVEQLVKVYVATKRKISVGDKMAGRHGNKGVVSKILPVEDMPYLEDGTPVDIVLNPLSVPSRMNVGQLLETHLGWAARKLGITVATPVFNGIPEDEIQFHMASAGIPPDGKTILYDGRTGKPFDNKVTVGVIYIMKLAHLVDDKMHARSTGPYSLVTQQPLGGKAQFGGQRLGEMEVWALEAYGAAYCLQEFLTVKSDDVSGRAKMYEAIVKGENASAPGIPESFNVLVRELQGLGLNIQIHSDTGHVIELKEFDEKDNLEKARRSLKLSASSDKKKE